MWRHEVFSRILGWLEVMVVVGRSNDCRYKIHDSRFISKISRSDPRSENLSQPFSRGKFPELADTLSVARVERMDALWCRAITRQAHDRPITECARTTRDPIHDPAIHQVFGSPILDRRYLFLDRRSPPPSPFHSFKPAWRELLIRVGHQRQIIVAGPRKPQVKA